MDVARLTQNEPMPDWFDQYRPHQLIAAEQVIDAFDRGVKLVVVDAPTGAGKTLIAEMVRRYYSWPRALYVCSTKSLQDQFCRDYPNARVLKGRANYPTGVKGATAADCTRTGPDSSCRWCENESVCPYEVAKTEAMGAPLAVLNTSYALTTWSHARGFSGVDLCIMDEADTLEAELMRFVEVDIAPSRVKRMRLGVPDKVTKEEAWTSWVQGALPVLRNAKKRIGRPSDQETVREWNYLSRLIDKLTRLQRGLSDGGWVYTGKEGRVSFKPVRVDTSATAMLWPHSRRWLLMSATVISPAEMTASLGWTEDYEYVVVPATFPVANRPVHVLRGVDMSRKVNDRTGASRLVNEIVARHPGERVLVHCVSYSLAVDLAQGLDSRPALVYRSASERETVLTEFRETPGAVLFAPSLDRGIDLPDDLCRVVIVAKIPFPYLGDRQVSARLYGRGGQQWYTIQALRTIVQMTGRATRHKDDHSVSYITDSNFKRLWSDARRLAPRWWEDALIWRDRMTVTPTKEST